MADNIRGGIDYKTLFDPKAYLNDYFVDTSDFWPCIRAIMECVQKIYSHVQVKGRRIIDIGCGPTLLSVIPAAKWFDEIFLADFSQNNIDSIQKWIARDPESFNWQPFFEFFAEKDGNRDIWQQYEDTLRAKITRVLPCDFFKTYPLDPESFEKFDAVTTCLALQSGTSNVAQYTTAMQNIASLIKPGGYFIGIAEITCSAYAVGSEKFSCVVLTRDDILTACKVSGVKVLQIFDESMQLKAVSAEPLVVYAVLGKKQELED